MLWCKLLISYAALFAGALAFSTSHVRHEKRERALSKHVKRRVDSDAVIPVRIGLRQSNLHTGYDRLMDISHPDSSNYGKHLTKEQVHDLFAPSEETINVVKSWLLSSGLFNEADILSYENKGWLAVDMPAQHAEELFGTEYYEHEMSNGEIRVGCDEYYLPIHVSSHVDFIKPGVKLSSPLKKRQVGKRTVGDARHGPPRVKQPHGSTVQPPPAAKGLPADLQHCDANITIACIKALYNIPAAHLSQPENVMGVFEDFDTFAQEDISLFFEAFAPNVPQGTKPSVTSVDGGMAPVAPDDEQNGGESDIDLDLAISLVYPQSLTVYQVDDFTFSSGEIPTIGFLNTFLDSVDGSYCNVTAFGITGDSPGIDASYPDPFPGGFKGQLECGTYELTRVVSISYGETEITLPKPYVERQCNEFMKLGLQGHSILVASGDAGVAGHGGSQNDPEGCIDGVIYNPDYPSGCPFITTVGATMLYPGQTVNDPESAMQINFTALAIAAGQPPGDPSLAFFATGGGFSNFFSPPSYQADAVANYLKEKLPFQSLPFYEINSDSSNVGENGGIYNRIGRGYPDVSANGAFLLAFNDLQLFSFFGTSLASPIFGSVITLINEERTAVGKGSIGFINPALYSNPSVLNDVTNGSNPNCGSQGFQASKGWDPVTGLGTPNYPKMLEYFMGLP